MQDKIFNVLFVLRRKSIVLFSVGTYLTTLLSGRTLEMFGRNVMK